MYLDFFSTSAQRASLAVTANCCQNMNSDEFHYIKDSMELLSARLNSSVSIISYSSMLLNHDYTQCYSLIYVHRIRSR